MNIFVVSGKTLFTITCFYNLLPISDKIKTALIVVAILTQANISSVSFSIRYIFQLAMKIRKIISIQIFSSDSKMISHQSHWRPN